MEQAIQDVTGYEAGLTGDEQIRIALQAIERLGGVATMQQLYEALEQRIAPKRLSAQGRASLRFFVNKVAVEAGYVERFDKARPGWRATGEGREYARELVVVENVIDAATDAVVQEPSNSVRGAAFRQLEGLAQVPQGQARSRHDRRAVHAGRQEGLEGQGRDP